MGARRRWTAALAAAAATLAVGLDDAWGQAPGGAATLYSATDVDFVDPGQTYYFYAFAITGATQRALYTYAPGDPTTPVPDLAAGPPEIAPDRRSLTIRLKPGVRYAPPVDREVVAGDVKYAIERGFQRNVANGYATEYFGAITGAPDRLGKRRTIRGIVVVDPLTLRLELRRPVADLVAAALVMPLTAPVPPEYAKPLDRGRQSRYDRRPAFTGPYVIAQRRVNHLIRLARNPNWDPATDDRPAYLDSITIDARPQDIAAAAQRVAGGSRGLCCGASYVPRSVLATAPGELIATGPGRGTSWVALNTQARPFRSLAVRRAVVAGMDRARLQRAAGPGQVATHFLPPGVLGHEEAGGTAGFADLDFLAAPGGNRATAAKYFRQAGFRSGRYTGRRRVTVAVDRLSSVGRAAVRQLRRLGFRLRVRRVSRDRMYTRFCGTPRVQVAICPDVGWTADFADPQTMLELPFSGAEITPGGNVNWSQLRNGAIDRAIRLAATAPGGAERNAAWAAIDRQVTAQAPGVPYAWRSATGLRSPDVAGVFNAYTGTWDLSYTGLR